MLKQKVENFNTITDSIADDASNLINYSKMDDVQRRIDLATAYRAIAHLGADDLTYTHLSVRSKSGNSLFIYPFGQLFSETTADSLLEVDFDGNIITGSEYQYNSTGYVIHGNLYKARPDLNAIFHLHTPEIVAVSSHKEGLMPISQWALHFYGGVAYHQYDSLALDSDQGSDLASDFGNKFTMLLRHHGSITAGRSIYEAMFYTYHLIQACKAQVAALSMGSESIIRIPESICEKSNRDLLSFEKNLGLRDWKAFKRIVG